MELCVDAARAAKLSEPRWWLVAKAQRQWTREQWDAAYLRYQTEQLRHWQRHGTSPSMWGVSVAATIRRAFDLGMIGEATYRRGFMLRNKTGQRKREDHPTLLRESLRLVEPDVFLAAELGVHSLADIIGEEQAPQQQRTR